MAIVLVIITVLTWSNRVNFTIAKEYAEEGLYGSAHYKLTRIVLFYPGVQKLKTICEAEMGKIFYSNNGVLYSCYENGENAVEICEYNAKGKNCESWGIYAGILYGLVNNGSLLCVDIKMSILAGKVDCFIASR